MITRFFKRKVSPKKKPAPKKKVQTAMATKKTAPRKKESESSPRILTAEGWKRLMMRKYGGKSK